MRKILDRIVFEWSLNPFVDDDGNGDDDQREPEEEEEDF